MFAIITTEEYRELLEAKAELEEIHADLNRMIDDAIKAREEQRELILVLTKGGKSPEVGDEYKNWDIESTENIADFINKNYLLKSRLQFEKTEVEDD